MNLEHNIKQKKLHKEYMVYNFIHGRFKNYSVVIEARIIIASGNEGLTGIPDMNE